MYYFVIIDKMASRAGWNGFVGRSLETPAVVDAGILREI